jgi:hypothetical protein
MTQLWLVMAAVATLVTACTHSLFGERRLIGPLVASQQGALARPQAQQVLRFAWHLTSLLWIGQALLLLRAATSPQSLDSALIAGIGLLHVGVGLFDGYVTRGKHIGWPMLTAIGAFCLLALA